MTVNLINISFQLPEMDPKKLGPMLEDVSRAAIEVGGYTTNISIQPYNPEEDEELAKLPATEYVVKINPEFSDKYENLSVHQCDRCRALVVEDFMPEHLEWHKRAEW